MAVDIGSVRPPSKFAWAAFDAPGRDLVNSGTNPESAVSALVPGLLAGAQAFLLLEAPMSVPVPDAVAAGLALVEVLDSSAPLVSSVCCWPRDSFNLLAAMALWAALRIDPGELRAGGPGRCRALSIGHNAPAMMDAGPGADG